jgi:hypothetical protein
MSPDPPEPRGQHALADAIVTRMIAQLRQELERQAQRIITEVREEIARLCSDRR